MGNNSPSESSPDLFVPYRTFMSPVNYRHFDNGGSTRLASLCDEHGNPVSVLDELIGDGTRKGFLSPTDINNESGCGPSQVLLLSGSTGAGKSTFALEMCCRMARAYRNRDRYPQLAEQCPPVGALYISCEEPANRLIAKTQQFGWCPGPGSPDEQRVVFDNDDLPKSLPAGIVSVQHMSAATNDYPESIRAVATAWKERRQLYADSFDESPPWGVLVIDSLNVLVPDADSANRGKVFREIREAICGPCHVNPHLLVMIFDAAKPNEHSTYWEYVSDMVFRFGWEDRKGYQLRTFAIPKMRDQFHVLGTQRSKIYGRVSRDQPARAHQSPFLSEGGFFIFPSLHWHLSKLQKNSVSRQGIKPKWIEFTGKISELNDLVGRNANQGLPMPGCTAFIGDRGSMKSHAAYLFLLQNLAKGRSGILISLRDDYESALETLRTICLENNLCHSGDEGPNEGTLDLDSCLENGRLEVIYNEAGNISAEELYFRIYVAINRPSNFRSPNADGPEKEKIVVVSGLDQIGPRFPLIASEELFVPGLIRLLKESGSCVLVSAATEWTTFQGRELHGLKPMADLLLEFSRWRGDEDPSENSIPPPPEISSADQVAKVRAIRVPAGGIGGKSGFLIRDPDSRALRYLGWTS